MEAIGGEAPKSEWIRGPFFKVKQVWSRENGGEYENGSLLYISQIN